MLVSIMVFQSSRLALYAGSNPRPRPALFTSTSTCNKTCKRHVTYKTCGIHYSKDFGESTRSRAYMSERLGQRIQCFLHALRVCDIALDGMKPFAKLLSAQSQSGKPAINKLNGVGDPWTFALPSPS